MSGPTATAATYPHAQPDPYRVLFQGLSAGAAHCRLTMARDQVVGVELLDSNRGFAPFHDALPRLLATFARVREAGQPEALQLRRGDAVLSVTVHPVGRDEALVVIEDVSAREQLEQRSRELQGRFVQVFHGNAAAMVIAGRDDLRIIDVNPRWLELFGATRDEVIGRTSVELGLISETRARSRIAEHKQFTGGHDVELELHTRAGGEITVLASAKPIEIAEGTCTLTTLIDITGRKRAEEAFAIAFSASPAGMMLVDDESGMVIAVNKRLLEMILGTRDDIVGRCVSDAVLVLQPSREQLLAEIARSGRLDGVEVELARGGGGGVWTLVSTERITLHNKVHRLTVFTDIAGRKRFERRLMTQHMVGLTLAETSELTAAIPHVLEALCRGDGWSCGAAWLCSADLATLQCCGTWCEPDASADATWAIGQVRNDRDGLLTRVLTTGAADSRVLGSPGDAGPAIGHHAVAFPILRGTTVLGVVALSARARDEVLEIDELGLFDSIGRALGLFVARSRAEASLRELNLELERRVLERTEALATSNRDLEAFTSSVSHDLRAPLRAIQGFSEILLSDFAATLPGDARDLIARIRASGRRLRELIDDVLAFSQLGLGAVRRSHIELDPLVRAVFDELLVGRALGDRVELRMSPLGSCRADPTLLRSVWTNLLDNALKYSRNRDRIVIEIGRVERGGEAVYYVTDNGVGFDMTYADRLFGVFQRLHSATDFEGTGIGLANVRRIVERHRGRVTASSELGVGSRFEFTIGVEPMAAASSRS